MPECTTSEQPFGAGPLGQGRAGSFGAGLHERIRREGAVRWDQFMELALYASGTGYYEREADCVGRGGDFFTAVSVGEVFGRLLAVAMARWLESLRRGAEPLWVMEAGAHDGRLAGDILSWIAECRPELLRYLRYGVIEPSSRRRRWQEARLTRWGKRVEWFSSFGELAAHAPRGVLFANEMLDALPVRRLSWDAARRCWREWWVVWDEGADSGRLAWKLDERVWSLRPEDRALVQERVDPEGPLAASFPDGLIWEHAEAALDWWRAAGDVLQEGWLLALDYGDWHGGGPRPHRPQGTLRAFRRQRQALDLLANPGQQDLTADVDFGLLRRTGEAAGWITEIAQSQGNWLTRVAGSPAGLQEAARWNAAQKRQFLTLVHPDHMGARFQVLVQRRRPSE